MRTEYIFLPDTPAKYQPRILRAPLRKENGLLENGNLYYIDRCVYSCGELTRAQCQATADDQCRGKCNERYTRPSGQDITQYGDLSFDFKPPANLPIPAGAPGQAKPPAAAPVFAAKTEAIGQSDTYVNPDADNKVVAATTDNEEVQTGLTEEAAPIGYGSPDEYGYGLGYYGR